VAPEVIRTDDERVRRPGRLAALPRSSPPSGLKHLRANREWADGHQFDGPVSEGDRLVGLAVVLDLDP